MDDGPRGTRVSLWPRKPPFDEAKFGFDMISAKLIRGIQPILPTKHFNLPRNSLFSLENLYILSLPRDFEDSKRWPKSTKFDVDALNQLLESEILGHVSRMGIGQIRDLVDQEELATWNIRHPMLFATPIDFAHAMASKVGSNPVGNGSIITEVVNEPYYGSNWSAPQIGWLVKFRSIQYVCINVFKCVWCIDMYRYTMNRS